MVAHQKQGLSTCISPQNAANRHGRSSQTCLVVPLHVVQVTRVSRVARPHISPAIRVYTAVDTMIYHIMCHLK